MKRRYSLDILKILATILIVFHHYQQITGARFKLVNFYGGKFNYGYLVEFFFILSGFFMYSYIKKIEDGLEFKKFFLKRVIRLLPMMAISVIVYEILIVLYEIMFQQRWYDASFTLWGTVISALGMQEGWGFTNPLVNTPTWYISVLLLCYIVFYIVIYVSKRMKIPYEYLCIGMIFLGIGLQTKTLNFPFLSVGPARGYATFFVGILIGKHVYNQRISRISEMISGILVVMITIMGIYHYDILAADIIYIMNYIFYPALIVLFSSMLITKFFTFDLIGTLGKISFHVYIWHNVLFVVMYMLIGKSILRVNVNSFYTMMVYTMICFIVGTGSYMVIEKNMNPWLEHVVLNNPKLS